MEKPTLEQRVAELETQVQDLITAVAEPPGDSRALGQVFLRMGLNTHYHREYYRFINVAMGDPSLDEVVAAWKKHFPHHDVVHLLEIGIALYQGAQSPASRLFMEAALKAIREEQTGIRPTDPTE